MARSDVAVFHLSLKCKKLLPLERTYTQVNNSSIIASPQHHMHAQFLFVPWPPIIAPVVSKFEKNEPFFILEQRGLTPGHRRGHARSVTATWDGRRGRGYHSHLYSPNWCCDLSPWRQLTWSSDQKPAFLLCCQQLHWRQLAYSRVGT